MDIIATSEGTTFTDRWSVCTRPLRMYPASYASRNEGWKPTSLLFETDNGDIVSLELDPNECVALANALIDAAKERTIL